MSVVECHSRTAYLLPLIVSFPVELLSSTVRDPALTHQWPRVAGPAPWRHPSIELQRASQESGNMGRSSACDLSRQEPVLWHLQMQCWV